MPHMSSPRSQAPQQPQTQAPQQPTNSYEFTDNEKALFGSFNLETPIARAWSRFMRSGHYVGKPIDEVQDSETRQTQDFQFAQASLSKVENDNQEVVFIDGRGQLGIERGL